MDIYSEGTGVKISIDKSTGLWLGAWQHRTDNPTSYNFVNNSLTILGVRFGNCVTLHENWEPRINNIKYTLNRWKSCNLNFKERAIIVNTMVGAGLSYLGTILPCPAELVKQMEKVVWNFIWNGKTETNLTKYSYGSGQEGRNGSCRHSLEIKCA